MDKEAMERIRQQPTLALQLKELRWVYQFTQEEFAELLGVKQATVSGWEHGVTPSMKSLCQITNVCDLPSDFFVFGNGKEVS